MEVFHGCIVGVINSHGLRAIWILLFLQCHTPVCAEASMLQPKNGHSFRELDVMGDRVQR